MVDFVIILSILLLIIQYHILTAQKRHFTKTIKSHKAIYKVAYIPNFSYHFKTMCRKYIDSEYLYSLESIEELIKNNSCEILESDLKVFNELVEQGIDYVEF